MSEVRYIQGYTVNTDYFDPIQYSQRIYDDKDDARQEALTLLKTILTAEEKLDEWDGCEQELRHTDSCGVMNIGGGWAGDIAKIQITEIYK
jgi:hypothetical protein